eukprot:PhM_4_TR9065/c0_g1_i1/m.5356
MSLDLRSDSPPLPPPPPPDSSPPLSPRRRDGTDTVAAPTTTTTTAADPNNSSNLVVPLEQHKVKIASLEAEVASLRLALFERDGAKSAQVYSQMELENRRLRPVCARHDENVARLRQEAALSTDALRDLQSTAIDVPELNSQILTLRTENEELRDQLMEMRAAAASGSPRRFASDVMSPRHVASPPQSTTTSFLLDDFAVGNADAISAGLFGRSTASASSYVRVRKASLCADCRANVDTLERLLEQRLY